MPQILVKVPQNTCKHCGHVWLPRKGGGTICPVCKREDWK